ncbi:MAG: basic amino acid ABC transporter substrate-binding protein [Halanaerobiales bacterium]|nr:basic amino acid ABC transporter substrate-binding protein [Halanaerobiales bacterium]
MKKLLITFLVLTLVFAFSAVGLAETYTVGTSAGFPPFEYVEDGEIVGFDIDLMKAIGEEMGFDVTFEDIAFDSLIPALKTGNIDVVAAGMTITEQREEVVDFSNSYYSADQSIIVKKDSDKDISVIFGDNDISVQTGTTGDMWATEKLKEKGILTGKIKRYDTFVLCVSDLVNGNVDAVVLDSPVANRYAEMRPVDVVGIIVTGENYGLAVNNGNTELLDKLNEGLRRIRENGKMAEIIDKHFK